MCTMLYFDDTNNKHFPKKKYNKLNKNRTIPTVAFWLVNSCNIKKTDKSRYGMKERYILRKK